MSFTQTTAQKKRQKTALAVLGVILLSAGVAAAIVFGGGIPLIPFLPLLAAAVVNPIALTAVVAGFTAVGLTILGGLTYGAVKLGQWARKKIRSKNSYLNLPEDVVAHPSSNSQTASENRGCFSWKKNNSSAKGNIISRLFKPLQPASPPYQSSQSSLNQLPPSSNNTPSLN